MRKFIAILFALIMVLCFCGCNSDTETKADTNAPESIINPDTINWGYDKENDKADRWYLQNSDDVTYIYFTVDDENVSTYNLVKSGVVVESAVCTVTDDYHLVPSDSSKGTFDLVFEDYFNAYDYSTDSSYSRGSVDEYNSYFADRIYTSEDELCAITFNSDFTCNKSEDKNSLTGTWEVTSPKTVLCKFGADEVEYKIIYNDDSTVKSIESDGESLYNEIREDETVNKYKVY